jgi:transposase
MQTKREKLGYEMMLLPPLEEFVPASDPLRKLNRVLDLSFVHVAVQDKYCADNGRPSLDPEVVLRLFVLQAFEGITSVRELMRQVHANLTYRWFIGYGLTEKVPDHSSLSKALDRLGDELFNALFSRSIAQCRSAGLIDGRVVHLDATVIRADLDACRVSHPASADPDARFGRGPGGRKIPAYKQQTVVDGASRVVLGIEVMAGNAPDQRHATEVVDQASRHLEQTPAVVCADSGYGTGANRAAMEQRGVRLVSPPQRVARRARGTGFGVEHFAYDETRDVFICPAGQELRAVGGVRGPQWGRQYLGVRTVCGSCVLRSQCTTSCQRRLWVSSHYGALMRLRVDAQTEDFRAFYRARAPVIEGVFAEGKQWHGLRRAWRRGLSNMRMQCYLIGAVLNFKRLAAALKIWFWVLGQRVARSIRAVDEEKTKIRRTLHTRDQGLAFATK